MGTFHLSIYDFNELVISMNWYLKQIIAQNRFEKSEWTHEGGEHGEHICRIPMYGGQVIVTLRDDVLSFDTSGIKGSFAESRGVLEAVSQAVIELCRDVRPSLMMMFPTSRARGLIFWRLANLLNQNGYIVRAGNPKWVGVGGIGIIREDVVWKYENTHFPPDLEYLPKPPRLPKSHINQDIPRTEDGQ